MKAQPKSAWEVYLKHREWNKVKKDDEVLKFQTDRTILTLFVVIPYQTQSHKTQTKLELKYKPTLWAEALSNWPNREENDCKSVEILNEIISKFGMTYMYGVKLNIHRKKFKEVEH